MPHTRITQDALLLGGSLASASAVAFPWPDWASLIGPSSGLVISVAMLIIFVRHSKARMEREDARQLAELEAREKHAAALLAMQASTIRSLNALTTRISRNPCIMRDRNKLETLTEEDTEP